VAITLGLTRFTVSPRTVGQNYSSAELNARTLFSRMEHRMDIRMTSTSRPQGLRSLFLVFLLVLSAGFVSAQSGGVELNPAHPDEYVVQRGDTLWDISGRFLNNPWFWPEIWQVNQQIDNPHLIFPGDLLTLVYIDGQPRVQLTRGDANNVTSGDSQRLSPRIREESLSNAISSIPFSVIEAFLTGGIVIPGDRLKKLPYVVALRDGLVAGAGTEVYTRPLNDDAQIGDTYYLYRQDEKLVNPENNELLGYEMLFVGKGELRSRNDETDTLFLTNTTREGLREDRVIPIDAFPRMNFFPSAPEDNIDGLILSVLDGVSLIGQYQTIIINRGTNHGLSEGNVLSIWQAGETVRDPGPRGGNVRLPETPAGTVMVVQAYPKISYALVMEATAEMRVLDKVRNP
jgi:hypothetical protein